MIRLILMSEWWNSKLTYQDECNSCEGLSFVDACAHIRKANKNRVLRGMQNLRDNMAEVICDCKNFLTDYFEVALFGKCQVDMNCMIEVSSVWFFTYLSSYAKNYHQVYPRNLKVPLWFTREWLFHHRNFCFSLLK